MLVSRLWEERRLAYAIKGHRKGTYWLTYFRLPGDHLTEIRQKFRLNDAVLRMLFLKVNPKIVDTLVAHALAGPAAMAERRVEAAPPVAPVVEGLAVADLAVVEEEVVDGEPIDP